MTGRPAYRISVLETRPQRHRLALFFGKIVAITPAGCWLFSTLNSSGYGTFAGNPAHRVAYHWFVGLAPGLDIHHICETKRCVNPAHLEALAKSAHAERHFYSAATCPNGHPRTPESTMLHRIGTWTNRKCRACHRATVKRSRERCAA